VRLLLEAEDPLQERLAMEVLDRAFALHEQRQERLALRIANAIARSQR
jgi:hypothetical protein